jgi:hypothetical protein
VLPTLLLSHGRDGEHLPVYVLAGGQFDIGGPRSSLCQSADADRKTSA